MAVNIKGNFINTGNVVVGKGKDLNIKGKFINEGEFINKNALKKINMSMPIIFYWEDDQTSVMTAAFKWKGQNFGMSFRIEDNGVTNRMNKKKLLFQVGTTLDVLLHHGKDILDGRGEINKKIVDDMEAKRFWLDKNWAKEIAFINKLMQTKDITKEQAKKLKLL